jgi:hypothetical protein
MIAADTGHESLVFKAQVSRSSVSILRSTWLATSFSEFPQLEDFVD